MIQIGNTKFEVPEPSAMRSFALQQRVLPVAGRLVGVLLQVFGKTADFDFEKFAELNVTQALPIALPALGEVVSLMPPGELEAITRELLRDATADGMKLVGTNAAGDLFDTVMRGRTLDTWRLLWHALKVWYPDFFALAGPWRAAGVPKAQPSAA